VRTHPSIHSLYERVEEKPQKSIGGLENPLYFQERGTKG